MSSLDQWGMDIFSLDSIANGHSIVAVTYTVLKVRTDRSRPIPIHTCIHDVS